MAALALVIVVAILTFWLGGKGDEMVSYVSFAAAGISIFLAITAIFYSFLEHGYSRQHIGQMDSLIRDASSIMRDASHAVSEKASLVAESAESMQETVLSIIGKQGISTERIIQTKPLEEVTFRLNGSNIEFIPLIMLYCLVESDENKKTINLLEITRLLSPNIKEENIIINMAIIQMGVMFGLSCFFDPSTVEVKGNEQKAKNLPSSLKSYIIEEVNSRIKDISSPSETRERLKDHIQKIDQYFAAQKE